MAQPHFLLFCDTHLSPTENAPIANSKNGVQNVESTSCETVAHSDAGRWHFVLEQLDGSSRFEVADTEASANRERLALMSVVRGLEALEQPSKVTLVTTSRYVSRGLRYGLTTWREAEYKWERFGVQMPVRNADLWQRIDGAMQFHGVTCRLIQAGQTSPQNRGLKLKNRAPHGDALEASPSPEPQLIQQPNAGRTELAAARQLSNQHFARPGLHLPRVSDLWWTLASAWIRWWRGRLQAQTPSFGT